MVYLLEMMWGIYPYSFVGYNVTPFHVEYLSFYHHGGLVTLTATKSGMRIHSHGSSKCLNFK